MPKHPTDHQQSQQEQALRHFWQAARPNRADLWLRLLKKHPNAMPDRRLPEYARIARGRLA